MTEPSNQHTDITELLARLPPELAAVPDRFEHVRDRVRRRRRRTAVSSAALVVVLVAGAPVALHGLHNSERRVDAPTTEPATALPTPTPNPTSGASPADPSQVPPGGTQVTDLGQPMTYTETGTATIMLPAAPAGVTALNTSLACLDPGRIAWPDGASISCSASDTLAADADPEDSNAYLIDLQPGETTLTFKATPGMRWRLSATYVETDKTPWGVNDNGQSYGIENLDGTPDLISAYATNGKTGYVYANELDDPMPTSPADAIAQNDAYPDGRDIAVYESDGLTRIGTFHISPGTGSNSPPHGQR